ncbi:MAG: hypothetical protein JWL59_2647 [Chthoniobacteraceae bacterium]|nr:hypothetical protein [Chthoniobacteraceae bacterium]
MLIPVRDFFRQLATAAAIFCAAASVSAKELNTDYVTPPFTRSPNGRYGVKVPVFHMESEDDDKRKNQVVELATGHVVAVIPGVPGYDRRLNYHTVAPARWSQDGSVLLWKIEGKWSPDTLVLIKIEKNRAAWQIDILNRAQQAVLTRTRKAAPKKYIAAKKSNAGNGSAYPDGFTIDVTTDGEAGKTLILPLAIHADLSANPKGIEDFPANLNAYLDAVVNSDGTFIVKDFQLGIRKQRLVEE